MSPWHGGDRRKQGERRKRERRRSMRYASEVLVVLDGMTWIDSDGSDRRRAVRRRADRERIARRVLDTIKK